MINNINNNNARRQFPQPTQVQQQLTKPGPGQQNQPRAPVKLEGAPQGSPDLSLTQPQSPQKKQKLDDGTYNAIQGSCLSDARHGESQLSCTPRWKNSHPITL